MKPILLDLPVPIRTPRLLLRPLQAEDGPAINAAVRESFAELQRWMDWARRIPTVAESEVYVRRRQAQWVLREALDLLVWSMDGDRLIGAAGLPRLDWHVPAFEIGYWLNTSLTGNGYATEAANALTRYAFAVLNARRVEIRCDAGNTRSRRIPERLGYTLEATLRASRVRSDGTPADTLVFARTGSSGLPALDVTWG